MDPWYALENGYTAEIFTLLFSEIKEILNQYPLFVTDEDDKAFVAKAKAIESKHQKDKALIEDYRNNEYQKRLDSGEDVPFSEQPDIKLAQLEGSTKIAVANLIVEYFNKDYYRTHKKADAKPQSKPSGRIYNQMAFLESLVTIRDRLGLFLAIIGYNRYNHSYFISDKDIVEITARYNEDIRRFNKGMNLPVVNLFDRSTTIQRRLGDKTPFIDIDNVSLQNLVAPYFKTNLKELIEIIDMIYKGFWYGQKIEDLYQNVGDYIKDCESKGLLIEVK